MAEVTKLRISELDFDQIKNNFKSFLKEQDVFRDYNLEGSTISHLLDILSYNTHYNAFYLNMVANEMFIDSATTRNAMISLSKLLGYVPKSRTGARANVNISITPNDAPANITVANVATIYVTSSAVLNDVDITKLDISEANVTVGNVATLYVPGSATVGDGAITINTDDFTTSLSANATLQGTTQITQLNSSTVTESGITVTQYGGALGTPTNKVWANSSGLHYQTKQLAGTDDATALAIALG